MKAIGWITSYLVVYLTSVLLSGWALTKLWFWFVVPTFHAPTLTIDSIGHLVNPEYGAIQSLLNR